MVSPARRTLRTLGRGLIWTLVALAALIASALLHLRLPIAKRVLVDWLHGVLAREIRGELQIGALESVGPRGIVARDVVLFDGEGRRVVQAKRLMLDPDMRAASALQVRFGSARLEDGQVWLFDAGDGLPSLLTSFDSRTPGPSTGEPLRVVVEGIELARVSLQGDLLGLEGLRAHVASAGGRMEIARDVRVRIDAAQGTVSEPFGFVGHVDSLTGTISTVATEGVDLHARAHRGAEQAQARIRLAEPATDPGGESVFELNVRGQRLATTTLRALGYDFIPELDVVVSGEADLQGPFSRLVVHADVTSEAGPARITGSISDTAGASFVISSPRMEVARLRAGAPELTVAGALRLLAPAEPDAETRLELQVEPLTYDTWVVPGLTIHGALGEDGVRIDSAEGRDRGMRVNARGDVGFNGAVDLRVNGSVANIGTDPNLERFVRGARGRLDADLHIQVTAASTLASHIDGQVTLRALRYGPLSADRLTLNGSARGDPDRPQLRLDLRGTAVRFGDYALGDPGLRVRGGPREYTAEGQFLAAGKRTFNASAKISAVDGSYVVEADPIEFAVGEGAWRGALQGLRITPGEQIELGLLRLASRSQRLEARGVLREHGPDQLDAQLQDFDLAAVHALLGGRFWLQNGRADAHVKLTGDVSAPELLVQGALRDGDVLGIEAVNALYFITYRGGQIEADGEVDLGQRGVLHLRGTGAVDPRTSDPVTALRRGSYDLELSGEGVACGLVPALRGLGISGQVSGAVRFQGTLDHPSFRGQINLDPLELPGWDALVVSAQGGYEAGTLALRASVGDIRGPLGSAEGQMQLAWAELMANPDLFMTVLMRGPWQLVGGTIERKVSEWPAPVGPSLPYPAVVSGQFALRKQEGVTSGELRYGGFFASTLTGTRCAAQVQLRLRGAVTLERGTSQFQLYALTGATRVVSIEGVLDTPVDRWLAQGHLDPPKLFRSSARVDIAQIQRLPYFCEYGNGSLRAELELDGGLSTEPILVASVNATLYPRMVRQARRKSVRVRSCQGDPIRIQLELNADRDRLRASGGTSGCHGGPIEVSAFLPVHWNELLVLPTPDPDQEIDAALRFDGAQLKPLLDRLPGVTNSDVIARGHVQLSGKPDALRWSGQLGLSGGRLYLVATGQELTDIEAMLSFHGDWAKLEMLSARQEDGRLTVSGGIGFAGLVPERLRLALHTEDLPIKREGVDMAWVSASAAVDAQITSERTRAAIQLHALELRLPDTTNRALQPLAPHPDVSVVTEVPEPRTLAYPIELVIDGRRQLTVRRNDFEAHIALDLALAYRDPDLNVGGAVEFTRGEFEVFGKRFEINSGALRFDGSTELNPDVYLIATQKPEAGGISPVTVSVTGTLAEPVVTFRSDECPGDLGAVTYLVSGRCAADDADLAQESGDARQEVTSGIVSGVLTLGAQRELGGLLPRIAIEAGGTQQGVRAGISSQSIVPKFMRKLVQRVYVQGGVVDDDTAATEEETSGRNPLDFLIELYFPHSIVGSGRFVHETWGVDVTWEP